MIGGREILYFDSLKALPDWNAFGVDLVIDCTGRAIKRPGATELISMIAQQKPYLQAYGIILLIRVVEFPAL